MQTTKYHALQLAFSSFFVVPEIKPSALHMLSKGSIYHEATTLPRQPEFFVYFNLYYLFFFLYVRAPGLIYVLSVHGGALEGQRMSGPLELEL